MAAAATAAATAAVASINCIMGGDACVAAAEPTGAGSAEATAGVGFPGGGSGSFATDGAGTQILSAPTTCHAQLRVGDLSCLAFNGTFAS